MVSHWFVLCYSGGRFHAAALSWSLAIFARAVASCFSIAGSAAEGPVFPDVGHSLPRDLAASAQDLDGWFSGMTGDLDIVVEVDEDMVPVGYGFELEAATGTIDLHHLADIAARIAEGGNHA